MYKYVKLIQTTHRILKKRENREMENREMENETRKPIRREDDDIG